MGTSEEVKEKGGGQTVKGASQRAAQGQLEAMLSDFPGGPVIAQRRPPPVGLVRYGSIALLVSGLTPETRESSVHQGIPPPGPNRPRNMTTAGRDPGPESSRGVNIYRWVGGCRTPPLGSSPLLAPAPDDSSAGVSGVPRLRPRGHSVRARHCEEAPWTVGVSASGPLTSTLPARATSMHAPTRRYRYGTTLSNGRRPSHPDPDWGRQAQALEYVQAAPASPRPASPRPGNKFQRPPGPALLHLPTLFTCSPIRHRQGLLSLSVPPSPAHPCAKPPAPRE
ncbi:PREDICTED: uncharacterized protein LOC105557429, partial [Vollenhovia emeryi]|uniref:uncharacterized protein LOC105557429 n=1 Tax=Vollenhovia emeryi TaxID=411798 RepID=UPI0005F388F1